MNSLTPAVQESLNVWSQHHSAGPYVLNEKYSDLVHQQFPDYSTTCGFCAWSSGVARLPCPHHDLTVLGGPLTPSVIADPPLTVIMLTNCAPLLHYYRVITQANRRSNDLTPWLLSTDRTYRYMHMMQARYI